MAERARFFDATDVIDYNTLTINTFDWSHWKMEETRRRYFARTHEEFGAKLMLDQGRLPNLWPGHGAVYIPEEISLFFAPRFRRVYPLL
jgi:hypothetical protein